jgi:hypothetical protein
MKEISIRTSIQHVCITEVDIPTILNYESLLHAEVYKKCATKSHTAAVVVVGVPYLFWLTEID